MSRLCHNVAVTSSCGISVVHRRMRNKSKWLALLASAMVMGPRRGRRPSWVCVTPRISNRFSAFLCLFLSLSLLPSLLPSLPLCLCDSTPSHSPSLVRVQACNVYITSICLCPNAPLQQVLKVAVVLDRLVMQVLCLQNK